MKRQAVKTQRTETVSQSMRPESLRRGLSIRGDSKKGSRRILRTFGGKGFAAGGRARRHAMPGEWTEYPGLSASGSLARSSQRDSGPIGSRISGGREKELEGYFPAPEGTSPGDRAPT